MKNKSFKKSSYLPWYIWLPLLVLTIIFVILWICIESQNLKGFFLNLSVTFLGILISVWIIGCFIEKNKKMSWLSVITDIREQMEKQAILLISDLFEFISFNKEFSLKGNSKQNRELEIVSNIKRHISDIDKYFIKDFPNRFRIEMNDLNWSKLFPKIHKNQQEIKELLHHPAITNQPVLISFLSKIEKDLSFIVKENNKPFDGWNKTFFSVRLKKILYLYSKIIRNELF